jgi:hypothetical protein
LFRQVGAVNFPHIENLAYLPCEFQSESAVPG